MSYTVASKSKTHISSFKGAAGKYQLVMEFDFGTVAIWEKFWRTDLDNSGEEYFKLFFLSLLPHLDLEVANGSVLAKIILVMMTGTILDPTVDPTWRWWWTSVGFFDLCHFHYISFLLYSLFYTCLISQLFSDLLISLHFTIWCITDDPISSLWL